MEDTLCEGSREWERVGRRLEVASLERGLAVGVRGRETFEGGSEDRESMMPAILRMFGPRVLRSAMTVARWSEG